MLTGNVDREVQDGKIKTEVRKLYFRGNGYIDAGCRFANDTVPDYIVFDKRNMAKDFIRVLEEGLKNSRTEKISDAEFKKKQKKEAKELADKRVEVVNDVVDEAPIKEEKLNKIKTNLAKLDMVKLQEIMAKYSIADFNNVDVISMEALDKILELI